MKGRWWGRLFRRRSRIQEAASDAFEAFAREMGEMPTTARTDEPDVETDSPPEEERRTPSFA